MTQDKPNAVAPVPAGSPSASETKPKPRRLIAQAADPRRVSALYLAAIFIVIFTLLNPGTFFTSSTMTVVFSAGAVTCLVALAFLVPLCAGAYDLSVGATLTLSLTICCKLALATSLSPPLMILAAVAAGALVGLVNGLIIVYFNINSFIATLGTSQVLLALTLLLSSNTQLVAEFPDWWSKAGNNTVAGIPLPLIYVIVIGLVLWYAIEFTALGRYLFATGGNPVAARLSGVRTERTIIGAMTVSGVICGIAGVVYAMQIGTASSTVGAGLLFPAVAAVFLGASQFSQRPNVWGTLVAYFALAFGIQGLTLSLGADATWGAPLFQGVALVVAVAIASRPALRALRSRKDAALEPTPKAEPARA